MAKLGKTLKRWTTGKSKFGFKGASPLNPFTHGAWSTRKLYRGLRSGRAMDNYSKYLFGGSRSASLGGSYFGNSPYGYTGSIVGRY